jgi:hypothetical protein
MMKNVIKNTKISGKCLTNSFFTPTYILSNTKFDELPI